MASNEHRQSPDSPEERRGEKRIPSLFTPEGSVIGVFLAIVAMCGWAGLLIWVFVLGLEGFVEGTVMRGLSLSLLAACLFAAPLAVLFAGENDPHANQLCLRGHQEWRSSYRAPMLVGKIWMPGGTTTYKVLVCEAWEQ